MKNVFVLFCISFLMIFSSCSSDDDSSSSRSTNLLKDVIGPNWSNEFIYDEGNKLALYTYTTSVIESEGEVRFTYSGDFITEIEYWYEGELQLLWSF